MNNVPIMVTPRGLLRLPLVVAAAGIFAAAQTSAPKDQHDFSKQAAIIQSYQTAYKFENDGKYTQDVTARIKIQSQAGVQQFGVLVFSYPSATQHIEIDYVRVRQPDGTVVVTPPSSIETVTPQVTIAAPEYSDFREKHVAVKGLVPGSELQYDVRYQTFAPLIPGQFWLSYDFTKDSIVLDEELEVSVPKDRAIKLKSASIQPSVTVQGDRRIYLWKNSNLKDATPRAYPAGQYPPPDVLLSSFESWAQIGKWWASLEGPQMSPDDAIRAKAAELTKGLTTEDQKLQAIYSYVAEQFRYIGISFGIGRYKPHAAGQVLANGYGDCKDKHTLLASLLQAAGIKAYPALINSSRKIDPDVPSPGQFDHVITVVPQGEQVDWMDTTTELAPMGLIIANLRGKNALIIPESKPAYLAMTPATSPVPDRVTFEADGELSSDGTFTGKIKDTTEGDRAVLMRLLFNNIAQAYWQKVTQGISEGVGFGGTVSNVQVSPPEDTSRPFAFSYDYVRKDYDGWSPQSPHEISPPLPFGGVPALPHSYDKTPQPFVLGEPLVADYRATIKLPDGWKVTLPKSLDLTAPFAEYHSSYSFKGGVVNAERRMITKAEEIPVAELDAYRKFQKAVSSDVQNQITLSGGTRASAGALSADQLNSAALKLLNNGGDASKARDLLLKATKEDPNSKWAWNNLGRAYAALGDNDDAISAYKRQIEVSPNDDYAYNNLGKAYAAVGETDDAIRAYKKQIEVHPENQYGYDALALLYWRLGRFDESTATYRELLQKDPNNEVGRLGLAAGLFQEQNYGEAAVEYAKLTKADPQNPKYELALGETDLLAGKVAEAAAPLEEGVKLGPTPINYNNVAYMMAEHRLKLPEAEGFAAKASQGAEESSAKISLNDLRDADLLAMDNLGHFWDTLGWVYFREGEAAEARKYIAASWQLGQYAVVADHLGQIDEKLDHHAIAIHDFALAAASPGFPPPAAGLYFASGAQSSFGDPGARARLENLVGSGSRADAAVNKARGVLSSMRTYWFSRAGLKSGTAEFFVLIGQGDKVEGVKFVSGDDSLRAAVKAMAAIKFNQPFPDDGPEKILRRGILSCEAGVAKCSFVLFLPSDVHSVN